MKKKHSLRTGELRLQRNKERLPYMKNRKSSVCAKTISRLYFLNNYIPVHIRLLHLPKCA